MQDWGEVIDFWFGAARADEARPEWFRKDPAFDGAIATRFGALIESALAGGLRAWDAAVARPEGGGPARGADRAEGDGAPLGALARIVVLDQFTRNVFRGTARAFAGDALALDAARALVARGADRRLNAVQRWFVYLPFEHAEDRAAQREALRLYGALAAERPDHAEAYEWALKHQVIVERFGRFPHRNALLGRASTADEIEFLRQPGSSF